jgi:Uncharacterised ACR (DUF711)
MKIRCLTLGISLKPSDFPPSSSSSSNVDDTVALNISELSVDGYPIGREPSFVVGDESKGEVAKKIAIAAKVLNVVKTAFESEGYTVQTIRISLNSYQGNPITNTVDILCVNYFVTTTSDWLVPDVSFRLKHLHMLLDLYSISLCSFGNCSDTRFLSTIPLILQSSPGFAASFQALASTTIEDLRQVAQVCIDISKLSPIANFGFCFGSGCPPNIPFFPAAYHKQVNSF